MKHVHTKEYMAELIARLSLHFCREWSGRTQIAALALDWADDLSGYSQAVVDRAAKLCRTEEGRRLFPTTGEMLMYCERAEAELRRHNSPLALPEPEISDEALELGRRRLNEYLAEMRRQHV